MGNVAKVFLFAAVLLVSPGTALFQARVALGMEQAHNILFISSYHPTFQSFMPQVRGLLDGLEEGGCGRQRCQLDIEFMDTKRFPGRENVASFRKRLEEKLVKLPDYQAFIIGDDNALGFALAERDALLAGRPIIFHGINDLRRAASLDSDPLITGVVEAASFLATLGVIKELSAPAGNIFIIVDETPSAQAVMNQFWSSGSASDYSKLEILSMRDHSYMELADKLRVLPTGTAALFVSAARDRTGHALRLEDFMKFLTKSSSVPIYTLWYDNLGMGVIGGKLVDPYQQGRASGLMAAEILAGRPVSDIPVVKESPNVFAFDWNIVKRFAIDVERLPLGSIVINKPKGLWEEHRGLIMGAVLLTTSLAILSFILVFYTARLRRLQTDLRVSEKRFRDFAGAASDWFWEMGPDLRFTYHSDRYFETTGFDPEDKIGTSRTHYVDADNLHDDKEIWAAHEADLKARRSFKNFEYMFRAKDGNIHYARVSGTPNFDAKGEFLGYRGTGTDITNRKRAEEELRKAHDDLNVQILERTQQLRTEIEERKRIEQDLLRTNEQFRLANRAKTDFLANMSHELRTPLNAIIGFSGAMKEKIFGSFGSDKYEEYVEDINESGKHLLELINDILDVSVIEAGKLELHEETMDINRVAGASVRLVRDRAAKGRVRLSSGVGDDLPYLYGDERRVKQIMLNLLSNAIKFTPDGGEVFLNIHLGDDGRLNIAVRDTGIGMTEEEAIKVLEPFGQGDSSVSRHQEGTGLGLSVTKGLAEAHGGSIKIKSKPNVGTIVTVCFPAERVIAQPAAQQHLSSDFPTERKLS